VLAVIFMMIGGFRWIVSAGGGQIAEAKKMITNAIIGLLIAFSSFVILQTINPALTRLQLPRIQKIKACVLLVDCLGYTNKDDCNNNPKNVAGRCSWSNANQRCEDLTQVSSGSVGKLGGACRSTAPECDAGQGTCVTGISGFPNGLCSDGGSCMPCVADSGAGGCGGGKCIDNKCAVPDPSNPQTPKRCAYASCNDDSDCSTGFCRTSAPRICVTGSQSSECISGDGSCSAQAGYQCTTFNALAGTRSVCCQQGQVEACLGCSSDNNCPQDMYCMDSTRYAAIAAAHPELKDKLKESTCFSDQPDGGQCDNNGMCRSQNCVGNVCKAK